MADIPEWPEQTPPIQLVAFDDAAGSGSNGPQLRMREEAKTELMKVAGSSAVKAISVCGVYRTGKSFLLNLLSGTQGQGRFTVGDSVQACTAGLWVRASKAGKDGSVCLLIDCEGSGNTERDREHDARLFALAVLISSLLVFNTRGVISDGAVQSLALAASLASHIFRQHKDVAAGTKLSPALLWVLRDFALALEDESGKAITAQEYLESMLGRFSSQTKPPPGADPSSWEEKREARERILELFPVRDCATLVRPVDDEEDLQRCGDMPVEQLRPKFRNQIQDLRSKVFGGCPTLHSPKGDAATGGAFLSLVESHVEALNSGIVPNLGDTWQHVLQQECGRAVDEAMREFNAVTFDFASSLPRSDEDVQEALERGESAARTRFETIAMGDEEARAEHQKELNQSLRESMQRLIKENETVATRENEAWIQEKWETRIEEHLKPYREMYDADNLLDGEIDEAEKVLKERLGELQAAYFQESLGPQRACQEPWDRIAARRMETALREVAAWRNRGEANKIAKEKAAKAAREEQMRIQAEQDKLAKQAAQEVEASKARIEAQSGGKKGEGGGKKPGSKKSSSDVSDEMEKKKQPKCCVLQ